MENNLKLTSNEEQKETFLNKLNNNLGNLFKGTLAITIIAAITINSLNFSTTTQIESKDFSNLTNSEIMAKTNPKLLEHLKEKNPLLAKALETSYQSNPDNIKQKYEARKIDWLKEVLNDNNKSFLEKVNYCMKEDLLSDGLKKSINEYKVLDKQYDKLSQNKKIDKNKLIEISKTLSNLEQILATSITNELTPYNVAFKTTQDTDILSKKNIKMESELLVLNSDSSHSFNDR